MADDILVLVNHSARDNIRDISPFESSTREAFGEQKLRKIKKQLSATAADGDGDGDEEGDVTAMHIQTLIHLCNALHVPENGISAVNMGLIPCLSALLRNPDATIRERCAHALSQIGTTRHGRMVLAGQENQTLEITVDMLSDEEANGDVEVRDSVLRLFEHMAVSRESVGGLIQCGVVPRLITILVTFAPAQRVVALKVLHGVLRTNKGLAHALEHGCVAEMSRLLAEDAGDADAHPETDYRCGAANNLALLSLNADGQRDGLECGAIEIVVNAIADVGVGNGTALQTRRNAAAALAGFAVLQGVKERAVEIKAPRVLIGLMEEEDETLLASVMQSAANIAESPAGRVALQPMLSLARQYAAAGSDSAGEVQDAARRLLSQLERE